MSNFNALVDRAMRESKFAHMRPVITKELLHYDILFCLDKAGLLNSLTFQGGTCLRLCYGAARFSEDLDFVSGGYFSTEQARDIKQCIETYIGERYELQVTVKEPKDLLTLPNYKDVKVDKWQVSITTFPGQKDVPKQKIKLEIANIPAYSREPRVLQKNYDFLPDGYEDTLIMVETLDEIMADKLVALPNCHKYVRNRDIWDLRWLKQQGAKINRDYILAKVKDYKVENYPAKLKAMADRLDEIIHGKMFKDEMTRFIPMDVQERTLKKANFLDYLISEDKAILLETIREIDK